jgi:AraC-like DNA-binding protein
MISNFHFLTNSLLAVICVAMGASFLSIHIPKKEGLRSYRISLNVLASAYFVLALLAVSLIYFDLNDNSREYLTFIITAISSIQALLFTFTLITLINPNFAKVKNVVRHTIPFFIFLILYLLSLTVFGDPVISSIDQLLFNLVHPTFLIRILFFGYYIFQLIYYTLLFLKEEQRYDNELLDYFSEVFQLRMNWVRIAFFAALFIGLTVVVSNFFPKKYDWVFNLLYSIFYFGFAQEYIKYNKIYSVIEPAVSPVFEAPSIPLRVRVKNDWDYLKKQVVNNRYYCETGVNIEDMARKLNLGRTTLSNIINREEWVNFNTWINKLRIEEAKNLLITNPAYSISIVSEMVGFSEQANFSRQFKMITGESPLVWRKKSAAS